MGFYYATQRGSAGRWRIVRAKSLDEAFYFSWGCPRRPRDRVICLGTTKDEAIRAARELEQ